MKKLTLLISIFCFFTTLAVAQKTVRKRPKLTSVQITSNQTDKTTSDTTQTNSKQFDTPLKILAKPQASRTDGQDCSQGKVVLRVTFLYSGEIGTISVISGLGNGLTEQAVLAAKKINFEPAMKGGKPVSITKPVEYSFTIY